MPIWQSVDKPKSLEQLIIDVVLTPYGVDTANVSKESLQAFRKGADPLQVWFLFGGESSPRIGYAMVDVPASAGVFDRLRRRWPYRGKRCWRYAVGDVSADATYIEDCPALYVEQALLAGNLRGKFAARWLKKWHEASFREWCLAWDLWPLRTTPFMVANYLHELWFEGATPEMIHLARRTISKMHTSMDLDDPTQSITCPVGCDVDPTVQKAHAAYIGPSIPVDRQRIIDELNKRGPRTAPAPMS